MKGGGKAAVLGESAREQSRQEEVRCRAGPFACDPAGCADAMESEKSVLKNASIPRSFRHRNGSSMISNH